MRAELCSLISLCCIHVVFVDFVILPTHFGERGGSVVVGLRSERSGVRDLPPPCCVLEQDTLLPESTG